MKPTTVCTFLAAAIIIGSLEVLCVAFSAWGSDTNEVLRDVDDLRTEKDLASAEKRCAELLQQYTNSPEICGTLYLTMAVKYENSFPGDRAKTIEASRNALRCPLEVKDACRAYRVLGNELRRKILDTTFRQQGQLRRETLIANLTGLKLALDHAMMLTRQPVPGVMGYTMIDATSNELIAVRAAQAAQIKARQDVINANELVSYIDGFRRSVVSLYTGVPYAEEIKSEGEKIMPGSRVLQELFDTVEANESAATGSRALQETRIVGSQQADMGSGVFHTNHSAAASVGGITRPRIAGSPDYEIEGKIREVELGPDAKPVRSRERDFKVFVRDSGWLIETVRRNESGTPMARQEVGSTNGSEIFAVTFTLALGPLESALPAPNVARVGGLVNSPTSPQLRNDSREAGVLQRGGAQTGSQPVTSSRTNLGRLAIIISNSVPSGLDAPMVSHLWLMFASHDYFQGHTSNRLTPLFGIFASADLDRDMKLDADWEVIDGAVRLPLFVIYYNDGKSYGLNVSREITTHTPYGPPYRGGFTNAEYRATGVIEAGGLRIPSGFTFEEYAPSAGRSAYDLRTRNRVEAVVTAFRPVCSRPNLLPALEPNTGVVDRRLAHAQPHIREFGFVNRKARDWPSVAESKSIYDKIQGH